jgi:hypothetical protein
LRALAPDRFAVTDVPAEVSFERDASGQVVALVLHQNGLDQRAPRTAELTLSAAKLGEYTGEFSLTPAVTIAMSVSDGQLFAQLTGQPHFPVFASAPDEFFLKVVNAQLRFHRDANGNVDAVVLRQNGREQRAPKK